MGCYNATYIDEWEDALVMKMIANRQWDNHKKRQDAYSDVFQRLVQRQFVDRSLLEVTASGKAWLQQFLLQAVP